MKLAVAMMLSISMLSCYAQDAPLKGLLKDMDASAEAAWRKGAEEQVALMPLATMFPDPKVRALADAAGRGRLSKVDELVAQGVSVDSRGTSNATPLIWAMRKGNAEGFEKLLALGADPNVVFDDGSSVMHWAVNNEDDAFLRLALSHGGDPNLRAGQLGQTPLFLALGERSDRLVILLDAGADPNAKSVFGSTPAMLAAGRGRFDVVHLLLERGADHQAKNGSGASLVDFIADIRGRMDPEHELFTWMTKVIAWLEARGVQVPEKR